MKVVFLRCKKCGSIWGIVVIKGGEVEYPLSCVFCGAFGYHEVEEVSGRFIENYYDF